MILKIYAITFVLLIILFSNDRVLNKATVLSRQLPQEKKPFHKRKLSFELAFLILIIELQTYTHAFLLKDHFKGLLSYNV